MTIARWQNKKQTNMAMKHLLFSQSLVHIFLSYRFSLSLTNVPGTSTVNTVILQWLFFSRHNIHFDVLLPMLNITVQFSHLSELVFPDAENLPEAFRFKVPVCFN